MMNKSLHCSATPLIIAGLAIAISVFCLTSQATATNSYGGEGDIGTAGGHSGGSNNDCTQNASCVHWQLVDNAALLDATNNTYWGAELTASERSALETCLSSKNSTGKTIIAAHTNKSSGQLEFGNIDDATGYNQRNKTSRGTEVGFNMNDIAIGNKTYEALLNDVMSQLGTDEQGVSIFCAGMDETIVEEPPNIPDIPEIIDNPRDDYEPDREPTNICGYYIESKNVKYYGYGTSTYSGPFDKTDDSSVFFSHSFRLWQDKPPGKLSWLSPNWQISSDLGSRRGSGFSASISGTKGINIGYSQYSYATLTYSHHAIANRKHYWRSHCHSYGHYYDSELKREVSYCKQWCSCEKHHSSTPGKWYWAGQAQKKSASTGIGVDHPYNFELNTTMEVSSPEKVYSGEYLDVEGKVTLGYPDRRTKSELTVSHKNRGDGRGGTVTKLIQFTIKSDVKIDGNSSLVQGGEQRADININDAPCQYFRNKIGANNIIDCGDLKVSTTEFDPYQRNGRVRTLNLSANPIIPDDENNPVGTKYCVALAAYYADSEGRYQNGMEFLRSKWNISGANCSTIAKKPNFEIWNNGLYTNGDIITSLSPKVVGSQFGNTQRYFDNENPENTAPKTLFGSWAEQLVVTGGNVTKFGSGDSIGYSGFSFGLSGGISTNGHTESSSTTKSISPLSISNTSTVGNSNIRIDETALLSRLKARYPSEDVGDTSFHGEFTDGVKVIYSTGTVTIDGDICYGSCNGDGNPSALSLGDQSLSTSSISSLPQVLIFAKDIKITGNVGRIDAWLIAEDSIDTCSAFTAKVTEAGLNNGNSASFNTGGCNHQLITNGPIFTKQIFLNRTGGADNGAGVHESGDVQSQNLTNDGSITPAEIFNLRPDTYLWAYAQAQDFTEAVVTYSRELAPRL